MNDNIKTRPDGSLIPPQCLSNPALYLVSLSGLSQSTTDRNSESWLARPVGVVQDLQKLANFLIARIVYPLVAFRLPETKALGKSIFQRDQGIRRFLPLARRRFRTNLPVLVLIRARKPCVFARFRLLGLNVGCMNRELLLIGVL